MEGYILYTNVFYFFFVNFLISGQDSFFKRVGKTAKSDYYLRRVRPSVPMEKLGSH